MAIMEITIIVITTTAHGVIGVDGDSGCFPQFTGTVLTLSQGCPCSHHHRRVPHIPHLQLHHRTETSSPRTEPIPRDRLGCWQDPSWPRTSAIHWWRCTLLRKQQRRRGSTSLLSSGKPRWILQPRLQQWWRESRLLWRAATRR